MLYEALKRKTKDEDDYQIGFCLLFFNEKVSMGQCKMLIY